MASTALSFKQWATAEHVVTTTSLEQFRGKRIGIDAEDYLHSLLVTGNREPLLQALGGQPFSLKSRINDHLENYEAAGIDPVFVFHGLDLPCKDRASVLNESRKSMALLNDAWQIYDQGKGDEAVTAFGKACELQSLCSTSIHRSQADPSKAPTGAT